jgi:hypothetical protein
MNTWRTIGPFTRGVILKWIYLRTMNWFKLLTAANILVSYEYQICLYPSVDYITILSQCGDYIVSDMTDGR